MKSLPSFVLLIGTSAMLTACGVDSSSPSPTVHLGASLSSSQSSPSKDIRGVMASVQKTHTTSIAATTIAPNINTLIVDKKSVVLGSSLVSGKPLSYATYGKLNQANITPTLFAQGVVSTHMPTTGKVTYQGDAVHLSIAQTKMLTEVLPAKFVVDFDKKVLTGSIQAATPISLGANILGNRFTGTVNDTTTTGYFYGEQAAELAGLYQNSTGTISGAFGAKR